MNIKKLKTAERKFLKKYPGGFNHPEMLEIAKKHNMNKHIDFAKTSFAKNQFSNKDAIIENMIKMVKGMPWV